MTSNKNYINNPKQGDLLMYYQPDNPDGIIIEKLQVDSVGSVAGYLRTGDIFSVISVNNFYLDDFNFRYLTILTTNGIHGCITDRLDAWVSP
jgi:hypothetical protein